jgi:tetratricopeptide (TPR) repeat protein
VDDLLPRAEALIEVKRAAEAATLLGQVLAGQPDNVRAWALMARCHSLLDQRPEMVYAAEQAVRADPNNEWGHRLLANALLGAGRRAEARRPALESVRLAPQLWRTHFTLATVLLRTKETRAAWPVAVRARELGPLEPATHVLCGDVLQVMADFPAARANYTEALRLDPDHHDARHHLAMLEYRRARPLAAATNLSTVVAGAPTNDEYVKDAKRAGRGVLWRLTDWSTLVLVVTALAAAIGGHPAGRVTMPLAIVGYAVLVWRILAATPRTIRAQIFRPPDPRLRRGPTLIRRHLVEPYPIVALFGIAALLLCAYAVAYQGADDAGNPLAAPGLFFSVIVVFRLRNRVARGIVYGIRRVYFRAGRRPRR